MVLDEPLEERIAEILKPLSKRWPNLDMDAVRAANRKQAVIPEGSTILEPVGTAPGLVVPPPAARPNGPVVLVLPGPPRELQPMWGTSLETAPIKAILAQAPDLERRIIRLFGMPESELAMSLRSIEAGGLDLSQLEITTCLRKGEIEIATTYDRTIADTYAQFESQIVARHGDLLFALNGETIDEIIADRLGDRTIAVGESCTGGLIAARLCDRPGASDRFVGGVVAYSNAAKESLLEVPKDLIEANGAVSDEVALAMARGAGRVLSADVGVGITGIAGPGGGTEDKPVGLVCFAVVSDQGELVRSIQIPGGRADVRERSTTIALHLVHRHLSDPSA